MNTVTPYPTLTPFPTPGGTPIVDLSAVMSGVEAGSLGPQTIQFWQMWFAPRWELISGVLLLVIVMIVFAGVFIQLKDSD